jgi:hypothetical protein
MSELVLVQPTGDLTQVGVKIASCDCAQAAIRRLPFMRNALLPEWRVAP